MSGFNRSKYSSFINSNNGQNSQQIFLRQPQLQFLTYWDTFKHSLINPIALLVKAFRLIKVEYAETGNLTSVHFDSSQIKSIGRIRPNDILLGNNATSTAL